jgi:predicted Fe-Mo cluster-binding NifX family protein
MFVVVDTESRELSLIINADAVHSHGSCSPFKALNGQAVDAVVVGGIGRGALSKLNQAGIMVYKANAGSIEENLALLTARELSEVSLLQTCGGHAQGGGCAH